MSKNSTIVALIYDFDETLSVDYMQAYGLIQAGFNVPNNMSTSTMRANVLKNSGWKWPWRRRQPWRCP